MPLRDWGRVHERIELHVEVRHLVFAGLGQAATVAIAFFAGAELSGDEVRPVAAAVTADDAATTEALDAVGPTRSAVADRRARRAGKRPIVVPRRAARFKALGARLKATAHESVAARSSADPAAEGIAAATVRSEPEYVASAVSSGLRGEERPCVAAELGLDGLVTADGRANGTPVDAFGICGADAGVAQRCEDGVDPVRMDAIALRVQQRKHDQRVDRARRNLAWLGVERQRRKTEVHAAQRDAAAATAQVAGASGPACRAAHRGGGSGRCPGREAP